MRTRSRTVRWSGRVVLAGVIIAAGIAPAGAGTASPVTGDDERRSAETVYVVHGADTATDRTAVVRTGVDVHGTEDGALVVAADRGEAASLRAKGFRLESRGTVADRLKDVNRPGAEPLDFPSGYENYHNFAELAAEIRKAQTDHGAIARLTSIGRSYEGRDIWMVKISDNVAQDENEPEVLFNCQQHAREILTREMCLRIINRLTDGYDGNAAIKALVDSREIYVVPAVNPDGAEYDIASGRFRMWRKNRQGQGTDLNRNWGYRWGCCGGSSGSPSSETYRGTAPFSAPEDQVVRNFVNSRVVGGRQQITANIDFHTYGELILWPFGYTYNDTAPDLTAEQQRVFQGFGRAMAATNSYTPQQSSDLYITDGSIHDWMWGQHRIWSYTFEMYGRSGGFYPNQSYIQPQTARNDRAVDLMLEYADCIPRYVGQTCT